MVWGVLLLLVSWSRDGLDDGVGYAWCEAPSPWSRVASSSVDRGSSVLERGLWCGGGGSGGGGGGYRD